jgi:hypothetical protein
MYISYLMSALTFQNLVAYFFCIESIKNVYRVAHVFTFHIPFVFHITYTFHIPYRIYIIAYTFHGPDGMEYCINHIA